MPYFCYVNKIMFETANLQKSKITCIRVLLIVNDIITNRAYINTEVNIHRSILLMMMMLSGFQNDIHSWASIILLCFEIKH